jgi:nitric oxide dioxygenase
VVKSAEITSFYLYPNDGGKVMGYLPGQYISVRLFLPDMKLFQPRQYSLSSAPNGAYYRISVKKETGDPDGRISNFLHDSVREGDVVELAPPGGDFTLATDKETPVVLVSGGVGQTPLLSMLEYLVTSDSSREVVWVHGSRNPRVHAFHDQIEKLAAGRDNVTCYFFYDTPVPDGEDDGYRTGVVDLHQLNGSALLPGADYYVCGPGRFILKQVQDLTALGVPATAIHYEEFGPATLKV